MTQFPSTGAQPATAKIRKPHICRPRHFKLPVAVAAHLVFDLIRDKRGVGIRTNDHYALADALRGRELNGPAETYRALRQATADQEAGGPAVKAPYDDLARQIGVSAAGVTDEQVASVVQATGSERAAFEIIAAAALGAGLLRWRQGIKVLSEAADAPA
jgi:hypothetical protein